MSPRSGFFFLLATVDVEPRFPFVDLPCSDPAFPFHRPDSRKNLGARWDVSTVLDHPVAPLFVGRHLFLHSLKKLVAIRLPHGLVMVHGVRIGGRSERNGVQELFL